MSIQTVGELSQLSMGELERELRSRQRRLKTLENRWAASKERYLKLDSELKQMRSGRVQPETGSRNPTPAPAPKKRQASLVKMLVSVLTKAGAPMNVGELTTAVQNAGYKTNSRQFRLIVNQTLLGRPEFRRTKRATFVVSKSHKAGEAPTKKRGRKTRPEKK